MSIEFDEKNKLEKQIAEGIFSNAIKNHSDLFTGKEKVNNESSIVVTKEGSLVDSKTFRVLKKGKNGKINLKDIKKKRNELHITAKYLAKISNISPAHISTLETGKYKTPTNKTLLAIDNALYRIENFGK